MPSDERADVLRDHGELFNLHRGDDEGGGARARGERVRGVADDGEHARARRAAHDRAVVVARDERRGCDFRRRHRVGRGRHGGDDGDGAVQPAATRRVAGGQLCGVSGILRHRGVFVLHSLHPVRD